MDIEVSVINPNYCENEKINYFKAKRILDIAFNDSWGDNSKLLFLQIGLRNLANFLHANDSKFPKMKYGKIMPQLFTNYFSKHLEYTLNLKCSNISGYIIKTVFDITGSNKVDKFFICQEVAFLAGVDNNKDEEDYTEEEWNKINFVYMFGLEMATKDVVGYGNQFNSNANNFFKIYAEPIILIFKYLISNMNNEDMVYHVRQCLYDVIDLNGDIYKLKEKYNRRKNIYENSENFQNLNRLSKKHDNVLREIRSILRDLFEKCDVQYSFKLKEVGGINE